MKLSKKKEKSVNPVRSANIFSKLFFAYTAKLFLKGYKKELNENDIFEVLPSYESKKLGDKFEKTWMQQAGNNRTSIALLLFKCYGKEYLLMLSTLIIALILTAVRPLIMKRFILYFASDRDNFTKTEASGYGILLILALVVEILYRHNLDFGVLTLAIKIRAGLTSLIYRRVLKLESVRLDGVSTGRIINLITKDVSEFEESMAFITGFVVNTLNIVILCCVLYMEVGWFFVVLVIMVVTTVLVNSFLSILVKKLKSRTLKKTDMRLQTTKEVLDAISLIKSYLWGDHYEKKLHGIRKKEVSLISKIYILFFAKIIISSSIVDASWYIIVVSLIFSGIQSNVGTLFLILNSVSTLHLALQQTMPRAIHQVATVVAVCRRIGNFLRETDARNNKISTNNFLTDFPDIEYTTGITAITGSVGSGKSFFLKAIATEHKTFEDNVEGEDTKMFSYASQEPWLFPSTIKENILFGSNYHHERYLEVLRVCALLDDLQVLKEGDSMVVADRGINLSRGQQARINLARAVYKDRSFYLLDDCLSHLDVLVAEFIFEECFKKFLKHKTVIIVTQNVQQINRSDRIIVLENRTIKSDTWSKKKSLNDSKLMCVKEFTAEDTPLEDNITESTNLLATFGAEDNIYKEVKASGKLQLEVYKKYMEACGGYSRLVIVFLFMLLIQVLQVCITKLEANWISSEQIIFQNSSRREVYTNALDNRKRILYTLPILIITVTVLFMFNTILFWMLAGKASVTIHKLLLSKVLNASTEFFSNHFTGNILNRFSEDMLYLDEFVPRGSFELLKYITELGGTIILAATVNIYFLIGCLAFGIIVTIMRIIYLRTGRALKRLEFSSRSPLLGHINVTLEGLATIRISKKQNTHRDEFDKRQNLYTSCSYMCISYEKAFHVAIDTCSICFTTFVILTFLILDQKASSESVGLGLLQIYRFTIAQFILYRTWSKVENYMTTVERILQYTKQKQESKEGCFVKNWPSEGEIRYEHVYLTYTTINCVLNDVSFVIKPKSKLAIVGRTASGKTSLTSTCLRLHGIQGNIYIDNVDISTLPLDLLRSNVSIISQDPILFSGTLRENIDPQMKCADYDIWNALKAVHLSELFQSLDVGISSQDTSLSTGQKQLICLCRALVRNNKIVILDEVTATVDSEFESVIHDIISNNFNQSTVIAITHKLRHILEYDKVLVLDKGSVVEFDNPHRLLERENGMFYKIYRQNHI